MSARWHCKPCKRWGLGGADGWAKHWAAEHEHNGRYGAALSFGFVPNFADGNERRYDRQIAPAVAQGDCCGGGCPGCPGGES